MEIAVIGRDMHTSNVCELHNFNQGLNPNASLSYVSNRQSGSQLMSLHLSVAMCVFYWDKSM